MCIVYNPPFCQTERRRAVPSYEAHHTYEMVQDTSKPMLYRQGFDRTV